MDTTNNAVPFEAENLDDRLTDLIADRLKSGDKLPPENQLVKDLGISRARLREALSVYESAGLITAQQGSGRYVRIPNLGDSIVDTWSVVLRADPSMLLEFLDVRILLELNSLSKAIVCCDVEVLTNMGVIVERMFRQVDDPDAFATSDCEFHRVMYQKLSNRILEQLLNGFSDLFIKAELNAEEQDYRRVAQQHKEILEAPTRQDLPLLSERMKDHFADVRYRITNSLVKLARNEEQG